MAQIIPFFSISVIVILILLNKSRLIGFMALNHYTMEQSVLEGKIRYKYRQFGLTTTFVTVPVQLMAFAPGFSTGNSPFMWSFIRVLP